jgi:hypothetical protein
MSNPQQNKNVSGQTIMRVTYYSLNAAKPHEYWLCTVGTAVANIQELNIFEEE